MRTLSFLLLFLLGACGPAPSSPAGDSGVDAGELDAGRADAGVTDAGVTDAGGWTFVGIAGTQCALGAQAGLGYDRASPTQLVIFMEGGGACWNNGTCHPSLFQWGPVCNYGSDSVCLWDNPGGTKPLAVNIDRADPYPADGGGAFPAALASIKSSLLFTRRAENPLREASYVFVPYCTGDLHVGNSTRTYSTKPDLFTAPTTLTHHFAGATNMDLYLAWLRTQHPSVQTIWLTGVSGGGYGAQLNVARVRQAFPEATVHLLADSAPMLDSPHLADWKAAWDLSADGGFTTLIAEAIDAAPGSRVALLSFAEDQVITRFFFSGGTAGEWLTPPYGTYTTNLVALEAQYDARPNARYFRLPGQEHVMLQGYGVVGADGGISAPRASRDGGTNLKAWIDAWATGTGDWSSQR